MFKISVVTVVKNDSQNILKTIKSVINQKNCIFEYLVIDGMSSDFTSNKLRLFSLKKFKYFRLKDKNLYDAINKSIRITSGQYIFLMHSGDVFYDDFVLSKIQKKLIMKPDIIYGNLKYFKKKGENYFIKRIWKHRIIQNLSQLSLEALNENKLVFTLEEVTKV